MFDCRATLNDFKPRPVMIPFSTFATLASFA